MSYNKDEDFYICADGRKLSVICTKSKKSKSGFKSIITIYECENCSECEYKNKCTKAKGNRHLHVSKNFLKQR